MGYLHAWFGSSFDPIWPSWPTFILDIFLTFIAVRMSLTVDCTVLTSNYKDILTRLRTA
jgi:hypothetical protein